MTTYGFILLDQIGTVPIRRKPVQDDPIEDGRFEFRVWPRHPIPAMTLLQTVWPLVSTETRSDIYLLSPISRHLLVKLRGGRDLEIKRRYADLDGLQYWVSLPPETFPLSRRALTRVAVALACPNHFPPGAGLTQGHLLASLTATNPQVQPRIVQKSRLVFQRSGCLAEITRASWNNQSRLTVALEGQDAVSVATEVRRLELQELLNRSYGDVLSSSPLSLIAPHI